MTFNLGFVHMHIFFTSQIEILLFFIAHAHAQISHGVSEMIEIELISNFSSLLQRVIRE